VVRPRISRSQANLRANRRTIRESPNAVDDDPGIGVAIVMEQVVHPTAKVGHVQVQETVVVIIAPRAAKRTAEIVYEAPLVTFVKVPSPSL
jgi:hypothetical protein